MLSATEFTIDCCVPVIEVMDLVSGIFRRMVDAAHRDIEQRILGDATCVNDHAGPLFGRPEHDLICEIHERSVALKRSELVLRRRLVDDFWAHLRKQARDAMTVRWFAPHSTRRAVAKELRVPYHGTKKRRKATARVRRKLDRLMPLLSWPRVDFRPEAPDPFTWALMARYSFPKPRWTSI